jgi:alginate O-acetyltransferase complex protein AlgI
MLFTSITFIFCFLPLVLLVYYVLPKPARNAWMILSSLVFYVWGEPMHLWVLLLSVIFNYGGALWIEVENRKFHRDLLLSLMIAANLGLLAWFKYSAFFVENWNHLRDLVGLKALAVPVIHLPLGISFFTFQAISYLLDVYRGTVPVERRLDRYTLYACLFPHLLAGPIVRYKDISGELGSRSITSLDFAAGIQRFILGLAKKLMIANTLGQMVDEQLALSMGELSTPVAWLFAVGYALQIYYDFSAYSDMAIGLGRMFGFHFPENFNFPYAARTVQGFWRGWHISLSTWFRDYLYIPMG